jgi:hypothetical protein
MPFHSRTCRITVGGLGFYRVGGLICAIRLKSKLGFDNFTVRIGYFGPFSCLTCGADLRKSGGYGRNMEGKQSF